MFTSNDTDLVIDITGYFGPPGLGGLLLYTVSRAGYAHGSRRAAAYGDA